jgi:hypothetical protein
VASDACEWRQVEMSRGRGADASKLVLFSPSGQALTDFFSPHDLRSQSLLIATSRPAAGGDEEGGGGEEGGGIFPGAHGTSQTIHVQVAFEAPTDMLQVQQRVAACLQACEGMLLTHGGRSEIREALLGFSRVGAGSHSVGGGKLGLCTR